MGDLELVGALNKLAGTSGLEAAGAANAIIPKLAVVSDTQPSDPADNQLWYDSVNEVMKRYDADTQTWNSGAQLLAETLYDPATITTITANQGAFADADATNLVATFTAASTEVLVELEALCRNSNADTSLLWNLRDAGGDIAATDKRALSNSNMIQVRIHMTIRVTGLTAGTSYTWKWGAQEDVGTGTSEFFAGGVAGAASMRVWNAPAAA